MKTIAKFVIAALLAAGAPALAVAQDTGAATTATDPMTTGSIGNYGALISSLQAGKMADLATFTDTSTVKFVTVSSLQAEASADPAALDNALSKNASAVASLKTSVDANAELKAKIEGAGYTTDKVLAITTEADGSFVVYIDDRA
jgi:hypothetical protein